MTVTVSVALITALATLLASISVVLISQIAESRRADRADRRERLAAVREPLATVSTQGLLWVDRALREAGDSRYGDAAPPTDPNQPKRLEAYIEGIAHLTLLLPEPEVATAIESLENARSTFEFGQWIMPMSDGPTRKESISTLLNSSSRFRHELADLQYVVSDVIHGSARSRRSRAPRSPRVDKDAS